MTTTHTGVRLIREKQHIERKRKEKEKDSTAAAVCEGTDRLTKFEFRFSQKGKCSGEKKEKAREKIDSMTVLLQCYPLHQNSNTPGTVLCSMTLHISINTHSHCCQKVHWHISSSDIVT